MAFKVWQLCSKGRTFGNQKIGGNLARMFPTSDRNPRCSFYGSLLGTAVFLCMLLSCKLGDINFEGKQCPCAQGWVCDPEQNICIEEESSNAMDAASDSSSNNDSATAMDASLQDSAVDATMDDGQVDGSDDASDDANDGDVVWPCEEPGFNCGDSNACTTDSCDPDNPMHDSDGCVHLAVQNGTVCFVNTTNACTYSVCNAGVCEPTGMQVCPVNYACNLGCTCCAPNP